MKDGFIKVAAASVDTVVADVSANVASIKQRIAQADALGVNLLVFPELCVTAYSCGDLFFSEALLNAAADALAEIRDFTAGRYPLVIVGAPLRHRGKLYNCAAALSGGQILAVVPKTAVCLRRGDTRSEHKRMRRSGSLRHGYSAAA